MTNRTDGVAAGFAGSLSLSGGAVVRECFSAGVVDAAANAAGFAYEISMRDDESQVRDCYSTAEVLSGENQNPAGFACRIADNNDEGGVMPVANCWFGGTVRCRGKASNYYKPYGFAYYLDGDVSFENSAWIEAPGAKEDGDRSQYVLCVANGSVAGTGNQAGGFVGQIGSTGLRFAQCSALGGVSDPAYSYVGCFVGQVNNSNDLWRCMSAGAAVGKQYVGGFCGYFSGGYTAVRECFALGDATATNAGDAYAGGLRATSIRRRSSPTATASAPSRASRRSAASWGATTTQAPRSRVATPWASSIVRERTPARSSASTRMRPPSPPARSSRAASTPSAPARPAPPTKTSGSPNTTRRG